MMLTPYKSANPRYSKCYDKDDPANNLLNIQQEIQNALDCYGESELTRLAVREFDIIMHCYKAIVYRIFKYFLQVPMRRPHLFSHKKSRCFSSVFHSVMWVPTVKPIEGESPMAPFDVESYKIKLKEAAVSACVLLLCFGTVFSQEKLKAAEKDVAKELKAAKELERKKLQKIARILIPEQALGDICGFDPELVGMNYAVTTGENSIIHNHRLQKNRIINITIITVFYNSI